MLAVRQYPRLREAAGWVLQMTKFTFPFYGETSGIGTLKGTQIDSRIEKINEANRVMKVGYCHCRKDDRGEFPVKYRDHRRKTDFQ